MKKLKNDELNRLSAQEYKSAAKTPIVFVLDNIRSHLNVGSVFRTADAFLLEAIYLCGITGTPPHREIQKTALGATETVNWHYEKNTLDAVKKLQENGYTILALEQTDNAVFLQDFSPETTKKYAIILGNEVEGVAIDCIALADRVIEIPQIGSKHSLNVSVSAGVVLWDIFAKLNFYK